MLQTAFNTEKDMENQFKTIQPWIPLVLSAIKKDIKVDHLPASPSFVRTHFGNRPLNRLTTEEIFAAYEKDLLAGDADLAEWVINHWVFQHGEIYTHFAERLSQISEDYSEIKNLTEEQSHAILKGAVESFGALPTYLFSVLNGVVFPESIFKKLRLAAEQEVAAKSAEAKQAEEQLSFEQLKERYARDLSRLQEKYEGKVSGVLKKYTTEVEALKKQIRSLQKQLAAK
jgi:polyhydroxyalkanoate synthesis regulator phasin